MTISGLYSFAGGKDFVQTYHKEKLKEIEAAIAEINASKALVKESKEKTMLEKMLYSPVELNKAFGEILYPKHWTHVKEQCDYPTNYYVNGYKPRERKIYPFRDMDFVKEKLGIEVQFGKYSFMVYNVCAKMTIFRNLGHINAGVEIVPVKELAEQMSTGVSYFEQFVWDLEQRGVSNIDVPVLIIGINT